MAMEETLTRRTLGELRRDAAVTLTFLHTLRSQGAKGAHCEWLMVLRLTNCRIDALGKTERA